MEGMNESYSHSSFFIATAPAEDFQISHTLKLAWVFYFIVLCRFFYCACRFLLLLVSN
jgi:hypothetical protein